MSRGKRSDFEMIHGEGILRVRNENQAKREKNLTLKHKKERARERQNGVGGGVVKFEIRKTKIVTV